MRLAGGSVAGKCVVFVWHQAPEDGGLGAHRSEALVDSAHLHDRRHALCSKTADVAASPALVRPNRAPRILFWRSQMSPITAVIRIRPMNTFCHCCGRTNELPSRRMI